MKRSLYLLIIIFFITACSSGGQKIESRNGFAVLPAVRPAEAVATFAGGCFWATQESLLQLKGVNTVISGYAGGTTQNPTYDEVQTGNTGHAESVQVYYDSSRISFEQLVQAFFYAHDPAQLNRQGPDVGSDYRSIAFYRTPAELKTIDKVIRKLETAGHVQGSIVTEVEPFAVFYPAESSHQDYYEKNSWDPYIRNVSKPKVMHVRNELPQLIKAEYLK